MSPAAKPVPKYQISPQADFWISFFYYCSFCPAWFFLSWLLENPLFHDHWGYYIMAIFMAVIPFLTAYVVALSWYGGFTRTEESLTDEEKPQREVQKVISEELVIFDEKKAAREATREVDMDSPPPYSDFNEVDFERGVYVYRDE